MILDICLSGLFVMLASREFPPYPDTGMLMLTVPSFANKSRARHVTLSFLGASLEDAVSHGSRPGPRARREDRGGNAYYCILI